MDPQLLAFLAISALLTITPGADMALVTRNTLGGGRASALFTTLGISSGIITHAFMWAIGLSALLNRSAQLYDGVKLLGAGYLVFLGIRSLVGAGKHKESELAMPQTPPDRRTLLRSYSQGLVTNVLNPKVALFYLTFLPQFIGPHDPVLQKALMLAGIHIGLGIVWLTSYAYLIDRLSDLFMRADMRRRLERVTGVLLILLGARLVWDRR